VSQTLTIGRLPEQIMIEMLSTPERFSVRVAYEVSKFHQDNGGNLEETLGLIEKIVRLGMTQRQVIEYRSRENTKRRGADPGAHRAPRQRAAPPAPIASGASPSLSSALQDREPNELGDSRSAREEYRSTDGRILAVLVKREGGITLDIQGEGRDDITSIVQSLRHLLTSTVR
jgi:hypothetical protein